MQWKGMSEAERAEAIGNGMEELTERRMNWKEGAPKPGTKNVLLRSFHDARATLAMIQREVRSLFFFARQLGY